MNGLTKDELKEQAVKLNVDIEGLSWPEQVKKVEKAKLSEQMKLEEKFDKASSEKSEDKDETIRQLREQLERNNQYISKMRQEYEGYDQGGIPEREDYEKQPTMIAPEMTPHKTDPNLSRYSNEEKIGEGLIVEEVSYGLDDLGKDGEQTLHGSYRIKGKGNRVVTAFSRGPRTQPGIYWHGEKGKDELFQEVTYNGEAAYLWSHVRAVIKSVNGGKYLKKYESTIKDNLLPVGHRLAINKEFVHELIDNIEAEEKARKERGL